MEFNWRVFEETLPDFLNATAVTVRYALIAIILAITGILNAVVGALEHNAGSVLVIINSALLLRWKEKQKKR